MDSVGIRIAKKQDFLVSTLFKPECFTNIGPNRVDDGSKKWVLPHGSFTYTDSVQGFSLNRQDRLATHIAQSNDGSGSRVPFDDEQFRLRSRAVIAAVDELERLSIKNHWWRNELTNVQCTNLPITNRFLPLPIASQSLLKKLGPLIIKQFVVGDTHDAILAGSIEPIQQVALLTFIQHPGPERWIGGS